MENMLCEMQSYTPQGLGNTNAVVGARPYTFAK